MRHYYKALFIFSIALYFVSSSNASLAQYHAPPSTPSMSQINNAVNQASSRQNMQWQMNQMANMSMMNLNRKGGLSTSKFTYHVLLKDSTILNVESKLYVDTVLHKSYLLLVDKQFAKTDTTHRFRKIYPGQTLRIDRYIYANLSNEFPFVGIPKDSCWMFRVDSGAINVYSYLDIQNVGYVPETIVGIQLDKGEIEHFNPANLKQIIAGDEAAMKYFTRQDYYMAIVVYNDDVKKAKKREAKAKSN